MVLAVVGLVLAGVAVAVTRDQPYYYPGGSDVVRLSADYALKADGTLEVTETIDYNYGHLGDPLARVIQVRRPATDELYRSVDTRGTDRVWKVFDVTATDAKGAMVPVDVREMDPWLPPLTDTGIDGWNSRLADLHIKVGEQLPYVKTAPTDTEPVVRMATFVVRYKVRGALERTSSGYELNWPDRRRSEDGERMAYLDTPTTTIRLKTPNAPINPSCAGHRNGNDGKRTTSACTTAPSTSHETVFTTTQPKATMTVTAGLPGDGFAAGAAMYDDSPTPASTWLRRLLIAAALVATLTITLIWRRRQTA